jgi:hypothetical protein
MSTQSTVDAALRYAASGWRTLPLHAPDPGAPAGCTCRAPDCSTPAKHPRIREWQNRASTDEHDLRRWFGMWPQSNVAIALPDRVFVLDIDPRHDGDATLAELEDRHGPLPATLEGTTGGGGVHIWLRAPGRVRNSAGLLGPGLDVRGSGGYVVVAPSVHPSGGRYEWRAGTRALAPAPSWLLQLLTQRPSTEQREGREGERIPQGCRDQSLFSLACALRRRGLDGDEIETTLRLVNERRCDPPLPAADLDRMTRSALRYAPGPLARTTFGQYSGEGTA